MDAENAAGILMTQSSLQSALEDIFEYMRSKASWEALDGDEYFASHVASEIADYSKTAIITTADEGVVGADTYVGVSSDACITTISSSILENGILDIFEYMRSKEAWQAGDGDEYFAENFAKYWVSMIDAAMIEGTTIGTETDPLMVSFPAEYPMSGTIQVAGSTVESDLKDCFEQMRNMTEGGDEYFAQRLSTAITNELLDLHIVTYVDAAGGISGVETGVA